MFPRLRRHTYTRVEWSRRSSGGAGDLCHFRIPVLWPCAVAEAKEQSAMRLGCSTADGLLQPEPNRPSILAHSRRWTMMSCVVPHSRRMASCRPFDTSFAEPPPKKKCSSAGTRSAHPGGRTRSHFTTPVPLRPRDRGAPAADGSRLPPFSTTLTFANMRQVWHWALYVS